LSPESPERALAASRLQEIRRLAESLGREVRIMEVCGTHTVSIRQAGLRSLLPQNVRLLSGPGCPVCVTPAGYIDLALSLLDRPDLVLATFGDMLKVPGASGVSLASRLGSGRLRILYSPAELPELARTASGPVVFLGVGFETTAPTVASAFLQAARQGIDNLYLFAAFKTVPPALRALLADPESRLDAFLLPGHVSAILGLEPYRFLEQSDGRPGAVTGFEPLDLVEGILCCASWQPARGGWRTPMRAWCAPGATPGPGRSWPSCWSRRTPCGGDWAPSRAAACGCGSATEARTRRCASACRPCGTPSLQVAVAPGFFWDAWNRRPVPCLAGPAPRKAR
jgi:hypothetical protein